MDQAVQGRIQTSATGFQKLVKFLIKIISSVDHAVQGRIQTSANSETFDEKSFQVWTRL